MIFRLHDAHSTLICLVDQAAHGGRKDRETRRIEGSYGGEEGEEGYRGSERGSGERRD